MDLEDAAADGRGSGKGFMQKSKRPTSASPAPKQQEDMSEIAAEIRQTERSILEETYGNFFFGNTFYEEGEDTTLFKHPR